MSKKTKLLIGILFVLVFLIVAVVVFVTSGNDEKPKKNSSKKEPVVEKPKVKIINEDSKTRPYAIMINNINVARPLQSGLNDAYIIYEMIVEGGITRYMALFSDKETQRIGSIRSARHYFLDYALENDAIYVHHGQSPQATSDFSRLGIDRIVADASNTGWRDRTLRVSSEHTLFTSIELLSGKASTYRTERNNDFLLNYSVESLDLSKEVGVLPANNVTIRYSNYITNRYAYDAETKMYKRFVNETAHTDYVTKEQYAFKNIITYQVENYPLNDGSGKDRQGLNNIGSGEGYFISEGYAIPITWEKTARNAQTVYKVKSTGKELVVNDGNTFIQIQPLNQTLTIE